MSPRILILGLPRTGTQSLADALQILGYNNVYHMREVGRNGHHTAWTELVNAKAAGRGDELTKDDFERLLKDFDAVADFPASIFGLELIRLYPDAKIIITTRSEDSWIASMKRTVVAPETLRLDNAGTPLREAYRKLCWNDDFDANGRQYWREYNRQVKTAADPDHTLVHELGDGWERLCMFLGADVPDVEYPNHDDGRKPA